MSGPPTPVRVIPLVVTVGEAGGHRLELLSAEVWDSWWDLRFARIATSDGVAPLPRRIPSDRAWRITDDLGTPYEVVDAVGRGDRHFSNGEVRLRPTLAPGATSLQLDVDLGPGTLAATVPLG